MLPSMEFTRVLVPVWFRLFESHLVLVRVTAYRRQASMGGLAPTGRLRYHEPN